jgi:hypothetical protein
VIRSCAATVQGLCQPWRSTSLRRARICTDSVRLLPILWAGT